MKVDLNRMDYRRVVELIEYCLVNQIDVDRAQELCSAWLSNADIDPPRWVLDIPEELITYFLLKWDHE